MDNIVFADGLATVKDFNKLDDNCIHSLKNINIPIRILIQNTPHEDKLFILNENVLKHNASRVTLVLSSRDKINWINLYDFAALSYIQNIVISNNVLGFNSIDGIQNFKFLKSFSFLLFYEKDINLELLGSCEKLEKLSLEPQLTKRHHEIVSGFKNLKEIKLKGLNTVYIKQPLRGVEYLEVFNLQGNLLAEKMPNLKKLRIYNSNKLTDVNFLAELEKLKWFYLWGLNNINILPDLSNLSMLKNICLRNMKRLNDAYNLITVKELAGLSICSTSLTLDRLEWLTPDNFPFIKNLIIELKNKMESNIIYERFKNIDKKIMLI
jgi:hypothetical protein